MKRAHFRLSLLAASITSLMSSSIFAAAFQLYELGTPIIGTAAVGQAAVTNDASIAYFNPAGMSQLNSTQFMVGTQVVTPSIHFSIGGQNTISGGNGGNAGVLTPGGSVFYVYQFSPKLKLGASFTTPYAGELDYTNGWVGRYIVQSMTFYAIDLNPALSYSVNNWLALGVGATLEYASLNQTVALPITDLVDGQANIKTTDYAPGFNIGILLTPYETTKIGIAYRSRILHDLKGNTTFLRISATPATSTKMTMPHNIIISLDQAITNRFDILGELGWSNWSSMQSAVVNIAGFTATTKLNWNNTYRIGLGAKFLATPTVTFQGGASYDSSPTKITLRTPDLPMDKQIRLAAGLMYSASKAIKLGFSYEYFNLGNAPINNTSSLGTLQGHYGKNYMNIVQASVNVDC
ncbi:MAG: outer membrane protein transport protein [Gammaproteobacteria bacterium]